MIFLVVIFFFSPQTEICQWGLFYIHIFLNGGKVAKMFSKIKDYTIEQFNDGIIDIFNGWDEKRFQLQNKNTIYSSRINKVMRFYE